MFCTKCGKEMNYDMAVCPYCGTPKPSVTPTQIVQVDQKTNGMAIGGFVVSLVSQFFTFWGILPLVGLILSANGLKAVSENGEKGKGLAIAGIVLSIISLIWSIISIAIKASGGFALLSLLSLL